MAGSALIWNSKPADSVRSPHANHNLFDVLQIELPPLGRPFCCLVFQPQGSGCNRPLAKSRIASIQTFPQKALFYIFPFSWDSFGVLRLAFRHESCKHVTGMALVWRYGALNPMQVRNHVGNTSSHLTYCRRPRFRHIGCKKRKTNE